MYNMTDEPNHSWEDPQTDEEEIFMNLTREELEEQVRHSLEYLVTEGVVIQHGNSYRLKSEEEIEQELEDIENGDFEGYARS